MGWVYWAGEQAAAPEQGSGRLWEKVEGHQLLEVTLRDQAGSKQGEGGGTEARRKGSLRFRRKDVSSLSPGATQHLSTDHTSASLRCQPRPPSCSLVPGATYHSPPLQPSLSRGWRETILINPTS